MAYEDSASSVRTWGIIQHLSLFGGFIVPGLGFVATLIVWRMKRDDSPVLDAHGRNALNWLLSSVLYGAILAVLWITILLIPILWVLGGILALLAIVFPIVAAFKAANGVVWRYPLSIGFLGRP